MTVKNIRPPISGDYSLISYFSVFVIFVGFISICFALYMGYNMTFNNSDYPDFILNILKDDYKRYIGLLISAAVTALSFLLLRQRTKMINEKEKSLCSLDNISLVEEKVKSIELFKYYNLLHFRNGDNMPVFGATINGERYIFMTLMDSNDDFKAKSPYDLNDMILEDIEETYHNQIKSNSVSLIKVSNQVLTWNYLVFNEDKNIIGLLEYYQDDEDVPFLKKIYDRDGPDFNILCTFLFYISANISYVLFFGGRDSILFFYLNLFLVFIFLREVTGETLIFKLLTIYRDLVVKKVKGKSV